MSIDSSGPLKTHVSSTFSSYCQQVSLVRLEIMLHSKEVSIYSRNRSKDNVHFDRMAIIFAQSKEFRLTMKVYYTDLSGQTFVKLNRQDPTFVASIASTDDLMKEFANQSLGALKATIEDQSGYAQTSLPVVTRSQDHQFFIPNPSMDYFQDTWQLKLGENQVQCAITLEFLDNKFSKKILLPAFVDLDAIGDAEFLDNN